MKNAILTASLMMMALGAGAEGMPQILGSDPLSREILTKTAQVNGGVTAAVRVASGQVIALQIADVSSAPFAAPMAAAAVSPAAGLKPAEGLAPKAVKRAKPRKPVKRAVEQLKRAAAAKNLTETR
ncbi:MAG: hypothetical protein KGJ84_16430 [Elusimicrobia bacterium]|nr:hypothetical protein [Elusimicrobiota bacterium]